MTQFARPNSDDVVTGWQAFTGTTRTTASLYKMIDGAVPDTYDYIRATGTNCVYRCGLSGVVDPLSSSGHTVVFIGRASGSSTSERLTIQLMQGTGTVIATPFNPQVVTRNSWVTYSGTLLAAEADSITNYNDLYLRFKPSTLTNNERIEVAQAYFEVPDIPAIDINLQPATLSLEGKPTSPYTPPADITINLQSALLNISGEPSTIDAPPITPITVNLQPAILNISGEKATIDAPVTPSVTVNLQPAALSLFGEISTIQKGGVSITLEPAQLSLSGKQTSVQKGAVSIALDPALLSFSSKASTIQKGSISVTLDPILLGLSAKTSTIQKGGVSIALDPALLTLSGKNVTLSSPPPGLQVNLQAASLSFSAKASTILKGSVTINLDPALLMLDGKHATPSTSGGAITINLQPARLSLSVPQSDVIPGDVTIGLKIARLHVNADMWWLRSGMLAENCKGVYQSELAGSYANSKINLNSPGVNNLTEAVGTPGWDNVNGWHFTGTSCFTGGADPPPNETQHWTMIVKFVSEDAAYNHWLGGGTNGGGWYYSIYHNWSSSQTFWFNGNTGAQRYFTGTSHYGVATLAGTHAYFDGIDAGGDTGFDNFDCPSLSVASGYPWIESTRAHGYIPVIAFYDVILTSSQILELTAAMNSLGVGRITISAPVQINLQKATLGLSAKQSNVQKGGVSIALDPALLSLNGKNVTVSAGITPQTINLDPALLSFSAQHATIVTPFSQSISLDPALLSFSGKIIGLNNGYIPPTPVVPTGVGGGGRRQIVYLIPEDLKKKKKRQEDEVFIIRSD